MNDLETLNCMAEQNKEIYLFPLSNVLEIANMNKVRSKITMLIDSEVAKGIVNDNFVGAFIVANKEQFYKIKEEIEE